MKKWELAYLMIEAKKNIDSFIYIYDNYEKISLLVFQSKYKMIKDSFYIKCGTILDKCFKNKKALCQSDGIVDSIYYERDKNAAHKDENYFPQYAQLLPSIQIMKKQLNHLIDICSEYLPSGFTLDYLSHDCELYRIVNGISLDKEKVIIAESLLNNLSTIFIAPNIKEKLKTSEDGVFPLFVDAESSKYSDISNTVVVPRVGVNYAETIQNIQDLCILGNIRCDKNAWFARSHFVFLYIDKLIAAKLIDDNLLFICDGDELVQKWSEIQKDE